MQNKINFLKSDLSYNPLTSSLHIPVNIIAFEISVT